MTRLTFMFDMDTVPTFTRYAVRVWIQDTTLRNVLTTLDEGAKSEGLEAMAYVRRIYFLYI